MSCMHAIEPRGIASAMCVFWRDAKDMVLVKYGDVFIEVLIEDEIWGCRWLFMQVLMSTKGHNNWVC